MYFVDRSAVVVKPTELFLSWLQGIADDLPDLTLSQLRSNCSVYLVPETDTPEETAGYFGERWKEIFSAELASWELASERWPELSPENFARFFDLEFHDLVMDTDEAALQLSPLLDNMM